MAKISMNIIFGDRVAANHSIEVEDRTLLGLERPDVETAMKEMAARLEKLGKARRDAAKPRT